MPETFIDFCFPDLSPRLKELVHAALDGRVKYTNKEYGLLAIGGLPAERLYQLEVMAASNMLANLFMNEDMRRLDLEGAQRAADLTMDLMKRTLKDMIRAKHDQILSERRLMDTCDCHVCQLRRRFEAGEIDPGADINALIKEAEAKDRAENPDCTYLTEEDLKNAASNPNESSPWRQGVAHSEQVLGRALSVPGGQTEPGAADGEGAGS